jgi:polyketide cyclase/dehydrase/lipid transport protein
MGRYVIDASARSRASREAVWKLVADGRSWSEWGPWQKAELDQEGIPPPDGVGAIRRLVRRPVVTIERVKAFDPPALLRYEMLSGLPLRGYEGTITLTEADGGTEISWHTEFDGAKILGTASLFRRMLDGFVADVAERLAREAERRQP